MRSAHTKYASSAYYGDCGKCLRCGLLSQLNDGENTVTNYSFQVKSQLAKLLATEDLQVRHMPGIATASFDIKKRILCLPVWNVSEALFDMLVVHEVGHALDTPGDAWIGSIDAIANKFYSNPNNRHKSSIRGFLNVIEDVRIDKRQKRRYPGSKRDYVLGHEELKKRDFFGLSGRDTEKLGFIDRANIYYKGGPRLYDLKFNDTEKAFLVEMLETESFDDVVELTERVYKYCKEDKQQDGNTSGDVGASDDEGGETAGDKKSKPKQGKKDEKNEDKKDKEKTKAESEDDDEDGGDTASDEDDLIGGFRLSDGRTVWHNGPVISAMERGAVLLLDEVDLGSNKLMCLQPVLEGNPIYIKKINKTIHPKPGFNIIATANTKGKGSDDGRFIGTNVLNEAFLERFNITLEQEYPNSKIETQILNNVMSSYGIDDKDFTSKLVSWAEVVRKTFEDGAVSEIISTRRLVHICGAFKIFDQDRQKAIAYCLNRFDADTKKSFNDLYKKIDETMTKKVEPTSTITNEQKTPYPF